MLANCIISQYSVSNLFVFLTITIEIAKADFVCSNINLNISLPSKYL